MFHYTVECRYNVVQHDITYGTSKTATEHKSDFGLTTDTSNLTLMRNLKKNDHIITPPHCICSHICPITMKFCTKLNSCTVLVCALFSLYLDQSCLNYNNCNLHWIWNLIQKSFVAKIIRWMGSWAAMLRLLDWCPIIWGLWSWAWISNCMSQYSAGCNYLSMP